MAGRFGPPAASGWARWNTVGAERPWTVGLEEEVMLLEPREWTLANRIDDVLAALPATLAGRASAETHACAVELATHPRRDVRAAVAELGDLRRQLGRALDGLGLRAAVAGTHPSALWIGVASTSGPRYRRVHASMRELARREPTFALHVHVAVPDGETAVRVLDGLRGELPLLLGLSANSPFWQGRDTGLASARTPIFSMFPRVGIPRGFASYREYVRAVDTLVRAGAIPDPSFLWWDVRLQPRLGTVEVRIMDAQTRAADTAGLAALVQCAQAPAPEVLAENRFLASRDGIGGQLVEASPARMRPAVECLAELLERCRPVAAALGCADELEAVAASVASPGHARQRALARRTGLIGLAAGLAAEFAVAGPVPAQAPVTPRT
jgi:carboxylate-amine ligase